MGQSNSITDSESEPQSGVSLAADLQKDIIREFESQVLQEEWNKFGKSVMQRRSRRVQDTQQALEANHENVLAAQAARKRRTEALDAGIEEMDASFVDGTKSLEYDSTKLLELYGGWTAKEVGDPTKESKPLPCLGPRAHWMDCQKKYASDSRPCNFYMEALEECVHQAITGVPGKES